MVPLRIISMDPKGLGSADAAGLCRCDNGFEYILKEGGAQSPTTPHHEWLCTHLAEEVGIACPPVAAIENGKGGHYFGSRCEGGVVTNDPWFEMVARGDIELGVVAPVLSRVFAFDCFVHNEDRHLGNFLARSSRNGWALVTFDFSRAWTYHGMPTPDLPLPASANTIFWHRELRGIIGDFMDAAAVGVFLDRLAAIKVSSIEGIIGRHPPEWISPDMRKSVLNWWGSEVSIGRTPRKRNALATFFRMQWASRMGACFRQSALARNYPPTNFATLRYASAAISSWGAPAVLAGEAM